MTIKNVVKEIWRYPMCRYYRKKLKDDGFTIISSDCIGGCLYHDLGLRFSSPTINLTITRSLDFFERLEHYLQVMPVPYGYSENGAPIILLEDLEVIGVHYHSHDELIGKWLERSRRIRWECVVIMTNTRFIRTETDKERFSRLPYPKLLFTADQPRFDFEVYAPALKDGKDLTAYGDVLGRRYFEKYVDCVRFLNESVEQANGR